MVAYIPDTKDVGVLRSPYKSETIDCNYKQIMISYSTEKERNDLIQFVKNSP